VEADVCVWRYALVHARKEEEQQQEIRSGSTLLYPRLPCSCAPCRDFTEFPELTVAETERRATLMDSIRQAGGVGRYRLRSPAESEARLRQREAAAATQRGRGAARGRGAPAGRGDLMRDLSAQLQLRGRAAPIRTVKR